MDTKTRQDSDLCESKSVHVKVTLEDTLLEWIVLLGSHLTCHWELAGRDRHGAQALAAFVVVSNAIVGLPGRLI
jgi:hypothetical protein